jgi:hypothetical protein
MSSDKLDREMKKPKVALGEREPKSEFDVPHDQLARSEQLEEFQLEVKLKRGIKRNILVYDSGDDPGQFTKRLISLMKTAMLRTPEDKCK